MTIPVDSTAAAALASNARGAQWLVELDFTGGTLRYTTNPTPIDFGGNTYTALGNLASVALISESEDSSAEKVALGFSLINVALLAAVLGSVETYRGRAVRLHLQVIDGNFRAAGAAVHRWSGYMEPVKIDRRPSKTGPSTGTITLPCSRAGIARSRNQTGLRLTHAQQIARFPGDLGLEFMQTLAEKPTLWLSKKFQEQ